MAEEPSLFIAVIFDKKAADELQSSLLQRASRGRILEIKRLSSQFCLGKQIILYTYR